jgi:hypothetical protein
MDDSVASAVARIVTTEKIKEAVDEGLGTRDRKTREAAHQIASLTTKLAAVSAMAQPETEEALKARLLPALIALNTENSMTLEGSELANSYMLCIDDVYPHHEENGGTMPGMERLVDVDYEEEVEEAEKEEAPPAPSLSDLKSSLAYAEETKYSTLTGDTGFEGDQPSRYIAIEGVNWESVSTSDLRLQTVHALFGADNPIFRTKQAAGGTFVQFADTP